MNNIISVVDRKAMAADIWQITTEESESTWDEPPTSACWWVCPLSSGSTSYHSSSLSLVPRVAAVVYCGPHRCPATSYPSADSIANWGRIPTCNDRGCEI